MLNISGGESIRLLQISVYCESQKPRSQVCTEILLSTYFDGQRSRRSPRTEIWGILGQNVEIWVISCYCSRSRAFWAFLCRSRSNRYFCPGWTIVQYALDTTGMNCDTGTTTLAMTLYLTGDNPRPSKSLWACWKGRRKAWSICSVNQYIVHILSFSYHSTFTSTGHNFTASLLSGLRLLLHELAHMLSSWWPWCKPWGVLNKGI